MSIEPDPPAAIGPNATVDIGPRQISNVGLARSARSAPVRPAPPGLDLGNPLLLPAFWLTIILMGLGAAKVGGVLHEAGQRHPTATAAAIIMFAIYAVPFWSLLGALDYLEREPPALTATAFAWGCLVATALALDAGTALHDIIAKTISPAFAVEWGPALAGAAVEEVAKLLGILVIVLIAREHINSVLDGFVYGALVGLGFQIVENMIYATSAVALAGRGDQIDPVVTTFLLRGFLAGLWSHTLFSGLAGLGVGYFVVRTQRSRPTRIAMIGLALLGAWACHALWNSPFWADGFGQGPLGILVVLVLKGSPALGMILLVVWSAHSREAAYYLHQLDALGDRHVITPDELRALGSGRLRAQARRRASARAGHRAARAVRGLQTAQARLAVALSRAAVAGPESTQADADVSHCHREVLLRRARLEELGHPEATAGNVSAVLPRMAIATAVGLVALAAIWAAIQAIGPA
ncbi:PrsW family intramembrane metalloprotease [Pilimelia columellifera]|uniref:Uncharacterized protein n=1 Tax=Pilimelia columellifera subsp. columellifera TaxID=706583 RepID=A0ABN3N280_9ACTN